MVSNPIHVEIFRRAGIGFTKKNHIENKEGMAGIQYKYNSNSLHNFTAYEHKQTYFSRSCLTFFQ